MRTLAMLLAIGAVSVISAASSGISTMYTENATSANAVIQSQSTSGVIEYRTEITLSAVQMLTVTNQISDFEDEYLKANELPIDEKNQKIKDPNGKDINFDYEITYSIYHTSNNTVFLQITFANFYSYVKYNGLTLTQSKDKSSLFFIERTTEFNAYTKFFDTNGQSKKTAEIISVFNQKFDLKQNPKPEYVYVLVNSQRHTKTNADLIESELGEYIYYFKVSDDLENTVKIFDRRANSPIWYGIAIAATAIAMSIFYVVVKLHSPTFTPKDE